MLNYWTHRYGEVMYFQKNISIVLLDFNIVHDHHSISSVYLTFWKDKLSINIKFVDYNVNSFFDYYLNGVELLDKNIGIINMGFGLHLIHFFFFLCWPFNRPKWKRNELFHSSGHSIMIYICRSRLSVDDNSSSFI